MGGRECEDIAGEGGGIRNKTVDSSLFKDWAVIRFHKSAMHSQATPEGTADHHARQQSCDHRPGNPLGDASHDRAKIDQDYWLYTGDAMNQQLHNTTGEGTKMAVVYDRQSQKSFEKFVPIGHHVHGRKHDEIIICGKIAYLL